MKVHCFFEQSGTFKSAFLSLGIEAYDYDIANSFGETDFIVDLFKDIDSFSSGLSGTVFDNIDHNDLIIAFFPCTYFSCNNWLFYNSNCTTYTRRNLDYCQILLECQDRVNNFDSFYHSFCTLYSIAIRFGFKLIIENPFSHDSLLYKFFPFEPTLIDHDRRLNGDNFKKPTMYYFVNCKPLYNFLLEPVTIHDNYNTSRKCNYGINRSLISSDYALRFIKTHLVKVGDKVG